MHHTKGVIIEDEREIGSFIERHNGKIDVESMGVSIGCSTNSLISLVSLIG